MQSASASKNLPASNHDLAAGNAKAEALIAHMQHDKKVLNGKLRFVLARAIGDAFVADDVDINAVKSVLETKQ